MQETVPALRGLEHRAQWHGDAGHSPDALFVCAQPPELPRTGCRSPQHGSARHGPVHASIGRLTVRLTFCFAVLKGFVDPRANSQFRKVRCCRMLAVQLNMAGDAVSAEAREVACAWCAHRGW